MENQFSGGIDAHVASLQVGEVSRRGVPVLEVSVLTREPARLLEVLAAFRPLDVFRGPCELVPAVQGMGVA
jgi:hypothetical protein